MKPLFAIFIFSLFFVSACNQPQQNTEASSEVVQQTAGQSAVQDSESAPNVLQVAISSPPHSTLVAAVKAAELVDVLSNAGPFTVFAPINDAFDALPAGTVENLLKPENKSQLINILEYHVYVGVISENLVRNGMVLNMVNGKNVTLGLVDGKITVNGNAVLGAVKGSNGLVYVIDKVLLPE